MTEKKMFYGWIIIPIAALALCFGYPGTFIFAFSSFILPLSEEFGWSRSQISLGITFSNVAMIGVMPMLGYLIDRYGTKAILLPATFFFGLSVCSLYLMNSLWHFYASILCLTILGGGASTISYVPLLATWFDKRKGLAIGLGVSGAGIGAMILPPLVNKIVEIASWREAYLLLGAMNLCVILPLVFFLIRNKPSDINQYPDGTAADHNDSKRASILNRSGFYFKEILHRAAFWKIATATLLLGVALTGSLSQLVPTLVDRGLTRSQAASAMSLLGIAIISARVLSGFLMDRFHGPFVASFFLSVTCLGFAGLAFIPSETTAIFVIIAVGIGLGVEFDVLGYFCSKYFGNLTLGRTYGLVYVIFNIGGALGVFLAGLSYDITTSYVTALTGASVATLTAVIITLTLGTYPSLPLRLAEDGSRLRDPT